MEDVDLDALARDLGFILKSEQREAVESLLRGRDVFGVLPTGFGKNAVRNSEIQVVYATAEQALNEKFTSMLKKDCPFRRSLSLIVVDESHTVFT